MQAALMRFISRAPSIKKINVQRKLDLRSYATRLFYFIIFVGFVKGIFAQKIQIADQSV